jgi:hypothetical protein
VVLPEVCQEDVLADADPPSYRLPDLTWSDAM